ncbi:hypothetical protein ACFQ3L_02515 [Lacticaseibacillus jixianensis]|uniref:CopG family transcriptional regulator n=1 Tax=Lacticaseibacillus jixianensis TaxID=2486012 RepID=A0ABW4B7Y1_9LACO|nr:hypothetical protein [Lacticaseibacillus jixianensis]
MVKPTKEEKLTFNLQSQDLAAIDLLTKNGFYRNRSDFVQKSIHDQLNKQAGYLNELVERDVKQRRGVIGLMRLDNKTIQKWADSQKSVSLVVYGLLLIPDDVEMAELTQVVKSIEVYGITRASKAIKAHYNLR